MSEMARMLIISGIMLLLTGGLLMLITNLTGQPKLPGDIFIKRGNFTFFFPIVTSILLSIILTIVLNLFLRK